MPKGITYEEIERRFKTQDEMDAFVAGYMEALDYAKEVNNDRSM